ncbi:MAG: basic amino acid ABC transporter substrate-binding protein [Chloroflexota bacterium]|nr:basic amino acid ABC transporter substrate-binding protein [Chloroflexota bacterium]
MSRLRVVSALMLLVLLVTAVSCKSEPANLLEKVEQEGKLIVGTSADYPPFEFVDEDGNYDGFDIVLMNEIAKRMEVEVEWQDIGFDGLIGSLQTEKIDAVIAAMSATAERDEQVDFTQPYYIGKDAVLVAADADFEITSKEDLAGKKIAVQTGTIQEGWVDENMSGEDISRYERAEQAVMDLKSGRVDLVAMDFFAASNYLKEGGVELALETEFASEHMSIAIPEGSQALQAKLDAVIQELLDEGFIEELALQYLAEE